MPMFGSIDWGEMFGADLPVAEAALRGTLVYFGLLVVLRIIPRRQHGSVGLTDVLLLVLLSEAVSAALNLQSKSVIVSLLSVATLAFWNFALDWAAFRWARVRRVLEPAPVALVRDGRPLRDNLEREKLTDDELKSQLRQQGVGDIREVETACIEPGGQVSVVKKDDDPSPCAACRSGSHTGNDAAPAGGAGASGGCETAPLAGDAPPDFGALTRGFLDAARRLQEGVAWHERRAADHARAAKEARAVLAEHGVRPPRPRAAVKRVPAGRTNPAA